MRQPINQKKLGQRSVNQTILRLDSYIDAIFITHCHLVSSSSSQLVSKSVADVMVISHSYGHMVIWSVRQSVSKSLSPFDSQPERQSVSHNQSVRQADSVNQAASQSFRKSVSEQLLSSQFASQLVEYVCQLANTTVSQ